jgi:hypothetical protein
MSDSERVKGIAMNTANCKFFVLLAAALCMPAGAQQTERRPGDHPAVVVQRLHAQQGYDYASKFYPHPAWLHLRADAPHPMMEHPAVIVFKRHRHDAQGAAAKLQLELAAAGAHR